jgi:hypothetical protein
MTDLLKGRCSPYFVLFILNMEDSAAAAEAEAEEPIERTTKTMDLDKLTLELLMNKTNYKKYIEKTDPKRFDERQTFLTRLRKYRGRILSMTEDYLENPDIQVSLDMNQALDDYMKSAIRYLEDQDIQSRDLDDIQLFSNDE